MPTHVKMSLVDMGLGVEYCHFIGESDVAQKWAGFCDRIDFAILRLAKWCKLGKSAVKVIIIMERKCRVKVLGGKIWLSMLSNGVTKWHVTDEIL